MELRKRSMISLDSVMVSPGKWWERRLANSDLVNDDSGGVKDAAISTNHSDVKLPLSSF